jgi:hypothetical protein
MIVNPGFIPHEEFHKYSWLLPDSHKFWYYFIPRENKNFDTSYKKFNNSVDKDLKDLVSFLHEKNIFTTPSCAGHFHKPSDYHKVYELLKKDEEKIKYEGMFFFDYEKGEFYFVRDKEYEIPFNEEYFIKKGVEYQKKGVIGITCENKNTLKKIQNINHDGFKKLQDGDITIFVTKSESEKENKDNWKSFTKMIKGSF